MNRTKRCKRPPASQRIIWVRTNPISVSARRYFVSKHVEERAKEVEAFIKQIEEFWGGRP